jgi:hypothetical protein
MKAQAILLGGLLFFSIALAGQENTKETGQTAAKDIDPLALQVLKAATDPIQGAKDYSFRALVSREYPGSDGQTITLFNLSDVTVERPDKIHLNFKGRGKDVELFCSEGKCTLYAPTEKLYTTVTAPDTIDGMLTALEKKDVYIPIQNFLESDPYKSLTDDLTTGYVVGRVMLFDQEVHQLAFTEPNAEWQLWVVGGEHPTVRRLEMIDKTQPEHPRIVVDFLDWNLDAKPSADLFTFHKPADAQEIQVLVESAKE